MKLGESPLYQKGRSASKFGLYPSTASFAVRLYVFVKTKNFKTEEASGITFRQCPIK